MSSYFDKRERAVSNLSRLMPEDDEGFIKGVQEIEEQVVREIELLTADYQFPIVLRIEAARIIHNNWLDGMGGEAAKTWLRCARSSKLLGELHSLFHRVAAGRVKTRWGFLTDNPLADLKCIREWDEESESESDRENGHCADCGVEITGREEADAGVCDACHSKANMDSTGEDSHPRLALIGHIRQQIARDPEGYANDAKFRACLGKIIEDLERKDGVR